MTPLWDELAEKGGLTLTDEQREKLSRFLDLLLSANERMNLTRISDRAEAEVQHVGDALTLLPHLPTGGGRLADVGTGGGVPGIPIAIVRPDLAVTLIEATRKKADFLREASGALKLENVQVVNQRAEDVGQSDLRETFDIAVARAVTTLDWLAEWCLPLVKKGGVVLAMKGPKHADEIPIAAKAIRALNGGEPTITPVELPGTTGHVIVTIPKLGKSDKRYPRPASIAKGKPLGSLGR